MDSIYWVLSRDCNQRCAHCYNHSEPGAPGLTCEEVSRCVAALPELGSVHINWIALSGGEVLVFPDLLFHTLRELYDRYGTLLELYLQTNGDLLDEELLDRLIEHHVNRIDISSQDKFHKQQSRDRAPYLKELLESRGFCPIGFDGASVYPMDRRLWYSMWGSTEDLWIGPLWPRGRARQRNLDKCTHEHRFCNHASGARGFLDYETLECSVNLELADVYPCCPMTCRPVGNLLREPLLGILDRCRQHPVFKRLNEGRPEAMGESRGFSEVCGFQRSRELGNHCLWCDEFFTRHAPDLLEFGTMTERGDEDLLTLPVYTT